MTECYSYCLHSYQFSSGASVEYFLLSSFLFVTVYQSAYTRPHSSDSLHVCMFVLCSSTFYHIYHILHCVSPVTRPVGTISKKRMVCEDPGITTPGYDINVRVLSVPMCTLAYSHSSHFTTWCTQIAFSFCYVSHA